MGILEIYDIKINYGVVNLQFNLSGINYTNAFEIRQEEKWI